MKLLPILLTLLAAPAFASTPTASGVQQSGTVTAGNFAKWQGKDVVGDGGATIPYSSLSGSVPVWNQNTTGNAATATALASAPALCSSGQAPTGILASGNATGCANYLTGNQTIAWTGSGDVAGSASGATNLAPALTLATVNSNVGTFQGITLNAKGLVTAASNQNYITLASLSAVSPITYNAGTGAISLAGILGIANGGTNASSFTSGSVLYFDGTEFNQNNSGFYWDNANASLDIGTTTSLKTNNYGITLNGDITFPASDAATISIATQPTNGAGSALNVASGSAAASGSNSNVGGNIVMKAGAGAQGSSYSGTSQFNGEGGSYTFFSGAGANAPGGSTGGISGNFSVDVGTAGTSVASGGTNNTGGATGTMNIIVLPGGAAQNGSGTNKGGASGNVAVTINTGGPATGGTVATGGAGGSMTFTAGNGGGVSGASTTNTPGAGGSVSFTAGSSGNASGTGAVDANGGAINFTAGSAINNLTGHAGGTVTLTSGNGYNAGNILLKVGNVNGGTGGFAAVYTLSSAGGGLSLGTNTAPGAQLQINPINSTTLGAIIKGAASQSADLSEWQNSGGTILAKVDASGNLTAASYTAGSSAGVSCSGTPSSSFATVNGIVTHC